MTEVLQGINACLIGVTVPIVLMVMGIYFTVYLRGFHLFHPLRCLSVMLRPRKDASRRGVSPFRAVTLALAGTLGVGNLVGVAGAIACGGPGAVFWMLLSAFLAMLLKYAEIVLALRYRVSVADGYRGGAMYYILALFRRMRLPRVGQCLAALFAVLCVIDSLSMGCIIQMNAVGSALSGVLPFPRAAIGVVITLLVLAVTMLGGRRISALTERLVPLMTLAYLVLSLAVLVLRREALPSAIASVWENAFRADSAVYGIGGFLFSRAVRYGVMRGLMSNEAGCGTAPIAHAESDVASPAEQGIWGIFEVFADTILLCSLTAAVILVSYDSLAGLGDDGMLITMRAYGAVLGRSAEMVIALLVFFFGFATVICWSHYGVSALAYLTSSPMLRRGYLLLYALSAFYGVLAAPSTVFALSDFALGVMTAINLAVLFALRREVKEETQRLWRER